MRNDKLSWLLFLALGAGAWYLRYHGGLNSDQLKLVTLYGPYSLIVVHVILVLMAFQDSVFQGILCLIIPLYSFYWLFMACDAFLVRAIVAALLILVAQDSAVFFQDVINDVSAKVKDWIWSGGGKT